MKKFDKAVKRSEENKTHIENLIHLRLKKSNAFQ